MQESKKSVYYSVSKDKKIQSRTSRPSVSIGFSEQGKPKNETSIFDHQKKRMLPLKMETLSSLKEKGFDEEISPDLAQMSLVGHGFRISQSKNKGSHSPRSKRRLPLATSLFSIKSSSLKSKTLKTESVSEAEAQKMFVIGDPFIKKKPKSTVFSVPFSAHQPFKSQRSNSSRTYLLNPKAKTQPRVDFSLSNNDFFSFKKNTTLEDLTRHNPLWQGMANQIQEALGKENLSHLSAEKTGKKKSAKLSAEFGSKEKRGSQTARVVLKGVREPSATKNKIQRKSPLPVKTARPFIPPSVSLRKEGLLLHSLKQKQFSVSKPSSSSISSFRTSSRQTLLPKKSPQPNPSLKITLSSSRLNT